MDRRRASKPIFLSIAGAKSKIILLKGHDVLMARRMFAKPGAALFCAVVFVLFAGTRERRQPANLEGYVYTGCSGNRLVGPVAGAVISTSVDGTTARTDANGRFQMRTRSPVFADEFYTVSVRAGNVTVTDRTMLENGVNSLPREESFVLSPPGPVIARFDESRQQAHCYAYFRGKPPGKQQD